MMANDYDDFINRFSVRNIQVNRDRGYRRVDYGYNKSVDYYDARDETIDIEIPRHGFEDLVRLNRKFDDWSREAGDEAYMRRQYPAIKEAYEKYKMLLELYR
jgi:hypothetical protein